MKKAPGTGLGAFSYVAGQGLSPRTISAGDVGLRGATLAVKDNVDVAGMPIGLGSRACEASTARDHALAVERLVAAGMRIIGKTHMAELAFGGWGTNGVCGTPRNPWGGARHLVAGGSSSGSAVAVAAGLADAALGTDTGGSVRIPASLCGIVGLKPSFGRTSRRGVHLLSPSLDVIGPMTRTVASAARMLVAMAGVDPADPATQTRLPALPPNVVPPDSLTGVRVIVMSGESLESIAEDVAHSYRRALQVLGSLGAELVLSAPPLDWVELVPPLGTILGFEAAELHGFRLENAKNLDANVVKRLKRGLDVTGAEYAAALDQRRVHQARFDAWLGSSAIVVTPTTPITAIPIEEVDEDALPLSRFTRAMNYLDWPAISLQCGLSARGLPIGLQFAAARGREAALLGMAATYERLRGPFPLQFDQLT